MCFDTFVIRVVLGHLRAAIEVHMIFALALHHVRLRRLAFEFLAKPVLLRRLGHLLDPGEVVGGDLVLLPQNELAYPAIGVATRVTAVTLLVTVDSYLCLV